LVTFLGGKNNPFDLATNKKFVDLVDYVTYMNQDSLMVILALHESELVKHMRAVHSDVIKVSKLVTEGSLLHPLVKVGGVEGKDEYQREAITAYQAPNSIDIAVGSEVSKTNMLLDVLLDLQLHINRSNLKMFEN
jgi:hypothetical protein